MNTFRTCDAIEFVRAMDFCKGDVNVARQKAKELNERMKAIEAKGEEIPSYLLAAYRGYETVISPGAIVTLDDLVLARARRACDESGVHGAMSPIDEAILYKRLVDENMTITEIAKRMKRRKEFVSFRLSLLALPKEAQKKVHTGEMTLKEAAKMLREMSVTVGSLRKALDGVPDNRVVCVCIPDFPYVPCVQAKYGEEDGVFLLFPDEQSEAMQALNSVVGNA